MSGERDAAAPKGPDAPTAAESTGPTSDRAATRTDGGYLTGPAVERDDGSPLTGTGLVREGVASLRRQPTVLVAMVLAGLAVAVVDWVRLVDPVPVAAFQGLTTGRLAVHYGVVVSVPAGVTTPLSALAGLKPGWLVWVGALELLRTAAFAAAGVYAFATLLDVEPTRAATARYGFVFAADALLRTVAPAADVPLFVGIPFVALYVYVVVHLVALPALLVDGESTRDALGRSWQLSTGHGWALAAVVVVLGLATFLSASAPVGGPVLAGAIAAVQVGTVAAFVRRVR
ncbi:hypothetical protein C475_09404 [Halosimplex carlsbadense 2-9-1]|uniref:Uncharacterized protein n=1 Tax=Halosimplex carlsbadense 2-9-1 TaxID=797114 RepID=M0CUU4_9EURY|nr:hypothetical protein [Halosimplex carlsbadense]ELZ25664.1 hypothetical protein C475_09404 [Halosimplex carlsbadense 2-9-1]